MVVRLMGQSKSVKSGTPKKCGIKCGICSEPDGRMPWITIPNPRNRSKNSGKAPQKEYGNRRGTPQNMQTSRESKRKMWKTCPKGIYLRNWPHDLNSNGANWIFISWLDLKIWRNRRGKTYGQYLQNSNSWITNACTVNSKKSGEKATVKKNEQLGLFGAPPAATSPCYFPSTSKRIV